MRTLLLGSCLLLSCPLTNPADAASPANRHATPAGAHYQRAPTRVVSHVTAAGAKHGKYTPISAKSRAKPHQTARVQGISCVPYARQVSGIEVGGNAWQWWDNAAGVYARGNRPEPGSVLAFRSNHQMRLGHVAVVSRVVNAREILIDHANWPSAGAGRGGVSRNIAVVDVSEANNWSAVRVELGRTGEFGAVYPTYGFIYDRPDNGMMLTAIERPAPQPDINPAPRDLRPVAERPWRTYEEVAEAPVRRTR